MTRVLLFAGTMLAVATADAQTSVRSGVAAFSVAAVRTDLDPDAKVGRKSSGLLCGPAGALRWRDLNPSASELGRLVATALRSRGVDVFIPSDEWLDEQGPPTANRLVPAVDSLSIHACFPHAGPATWVGAAARVKASGEISVTWRNYDRTSRRLLWAHKIVEPFSFDREARDGRTVVAIAIAATAEKLADIMLEAGEAPLKP